MAKSRTFIFSIVQRPTISTGGSILNSIICFPSETRCFSRQAMTSNIAWQRHGCYTLGSQQYFNMPLDKSAIGCQDEWNSLDHFDPTSATRRIFAQFNYLRTVYGALQDGFDLVQRGNWTYQIQRPGSNNTATEMGLWTASRAAITGVQNLTGVFNDQVWLLYTNENVTKTFTFDCKSQGWISTPFESGTVVQNLFAPYETYTLTDSLSSFFNNSQPPWQGCLPSVTMDPLGFKALVPVAQWVPPLPALTKFTPGHDARIHAEAGDANATSLDISFEFNVAMSCTSVTNSMTFNMSSSGIGGNPTVLQSSIVCANVTNPDPSPVSGVSISQWSWSATLQNVPDGILSIQLNNPAAAVGNASTGVRIYSFKRDLQTYSVRFHRPLTRFWSGKDLLPM
jgi:alpha-1,3-glucan synthase